MVINTKAARCRRQFLRFFTDGFQDETYLDWERDYKWATRKRWVAALGQSEFDRLPDEIDGIVYGAAPGSEIE